MIRRISVPTISIGRIGMWKIRSGRTMRTISLRNTIGWRKAWRISIRRTWIRE